MATVPGKWMPNSPEMQVLVRTVRLGYHDLCLRLQALPTLGARWVRSRASRGFTCERLWKSPYLWVIRHRNSLNKELILSLLLSRDYSCKSTPDTPLQPLRVVVVTSFQLGRLLSSRHRSRTKRKSTTTTQSTNPSRDTANIRRNPSCIFRASSYIAASAV